MPVGEGLTLPAALQSLRHFLCENATSLYTREAFVWFSPYYLVLPLLIVGDDVPYRFGGGFDVVIVGTGVLDGPKNRTQSTPLRV